MADDLFKEWEKELSQYKNREMKAESERELQETRRRTEAPAGLDAPGGAAHRARVAALRDRVLFLKHNLNAKALGALTKELSAVEGSVDSLVEDLRQSIAEADAFLSEMEKERSRQRRVW